MRFQKYRLTIYGPSTHHPISSCHLRTICRSSTDHLRTYNLFVPSTNHLYTILSLSIVRVRRKNFSFSKICIDEPHEYHLIDERHLKTIYGPSTHHPISSCHLRTICRPSTDHLISKCHLRAIRASSYL